MQKKNRKVSVRFTESEYKELRRDRVDKTTSAYLKDLIIRSRLNDIKEASELINLAKEIAESVRIIKKRGDK
ncbi:MAG: hypothetical protein ABSB95_11780 [Dissulfurispiraceae bacterium]|jgi:hypothetical protein